MTACMNVSLIRFDCGRLYSRHATVTRHGMGSVKGRDEYGMNTWTCSRGDIRVEARLHLTLEQSRPAVAGAGRGRNGLELEKPL
jgi:hypothetical protein